jgi:hypothetical protein
MKKRFLLFGLIFALMTVVSQAQIYEMYSQDFETGTPVNYTVQCSSSSSAGAPQSTIYSGGSRAMRLLNVQSAVNYMYLDTIDFSQNALLRFYTLEFQHIAFVSPLQLQARTEGCIIEARRPSDPEGQWIQLSSTHYNMVEGGSTEFISLGSFSREAYGECNSATSANNVLWESER